MPSQLTDSLCTHCALCCDGSLFADVELSGPAETTRLEILGLEVEDDGAKGGLLIQPCAALQGRRCGIYEHRPGCCRTFECRLLQDVRRGTVSLERARKHVDDALTLVGKARAHLHGLGDPGPWLPLAERAAEALSAGTNERRAAKAHHAALKTTMARLGILLRERFLAPRG